MNQRHVWLVRLYPPVWQERYGDELAALLEDLEPCSTRERLIATLGVVRGAAVQRLRYDGLVGDVRDRATRAKAGLLLIVGAWAAVVVAGLAFAKFSEGEQPAPTEFTVVQVLAVLIAMVLLVGIAVATPSAIAALRSGAWRMVRRPCVVAASLCIATLAVATVIVGWAHRLTFAERNGGDTAYAAAATVAALLIVTTLAALLRAGMALAHETKLGPRALRIAGALGVVATAGMLSLTIATLAWWVASSRAASSLAGPGRGDPHLAPTMAVIAVVMMAASALSVAGSARTIAALRQR